VRLWDYAPLPLEWRYGLWHPHGDTDRSTEGCPVAETCDTADVTGRIVARSASPEPGERVTEEFAVDAGTTVEDDRMANVFAGLGGLYRFERIRGMGCPCEYVERFGCPVIEGRADGEALFLSFHAPDTEILRDVVTDRRARFDGVSIRRLTQSSEDEPSHGLVVIDRGRFTDRRYEVLATAHRMGYFEYPKGANAGEGAEALGIVRATFTEHLAAARTKLGEALLDV